MSVNYGSKRLVVGAHYGLRDWLAQRVTGVLMALFTIIVLGQLMLSSGPIGYDKWAGIFSSQWMKVLTFSVILALLYHVWIGMRDIWMDYVTSAVWLRLVLQVATIVWLIGCAGWGSCASAIAVSARLASITPALMPRPCCSLVMTGELIRPTV